MDKLASLGSDVSTNMTEFAVIIDLQGSHTSADTSLTPEDNSLAPSIPETEAQVMVMYFYNLRAWCALIVDTLTGTLVESP